MSKVVQTVLGPVSAEALGVTFPHEHLSMDYEAAAFTAPLPKDVMKVDLCFSMPNLGWIRQYPYSCKANLRLDHAQPEVLAEMKALREAGGGTVVENTTFGIHRDLNFLQKVQAETGINVILGTGYYVDKVHPGDMRAQSVEGLAEVMRREMEEGCEGGELRCGVMGELGCSWPLTSNEKKVLQGAAAVQAGF